MVQDLVLDSVLAQQVSVQSDSPSSFSSSSSSGSRFGFYSFVDDPTSPEAEQNSAWMISPQRQAMLATLKEENGFKLQTYSGSRKPESLFPESDEDSEYRLGPRDRVQELGDDEEKLLRQDIIRSQAPKILDLSQAPSQAPKALDLSQASNVQDQSQAPKVQDISRSTNKLVEGYSLSFTPRPNFLPQPAEPGTINSEQINFSAARQQFLRMEQDRLLDILSPPRSWSNPDLSWSGRVKLSKELNSRKKTEESPSSPTNGVGSRLDEPSLNLGSETPIQREIRLVQEREENLRLSRGLKPSKVEMVQIQTKLLHTPKTPEKNRVSLVIQQEIEKNQKEEPGQQEQERGEEFPSPCCPHRHSKETALLISQETSVASSTQTDSGVHRGTRSWLDNLESGLTSRGPGALDFVEREIEEALRREQELRESRRRYEAQMFSPPPLVEQATKMAVLQFYPAANTGMSLWSVGV